VEVALVGIAVALALVFGLIRVSMSAGEGRKAKKDLDATSKAAERVEKARASKPLRGTDLVDSLRKRKRKP